MTKAYIYIYVAPARCYVIMRKMTDGVMFKVELKCTAMYTTMHYIRNKSCRSV